MFVYSFGVSGGGGGGEGMKGAPIFFGRAEGGENVNHFVITFSVKKKRKKITHLY